MTSAEYWQEVQARILDKPRYLRNGQIAFNTLHDFRPRLANEIRGSELDPFHASRIPENFTLWVNENWERKDGE